MKLPLDMIGLWSKSDSVKTKVFNESKISSCSVGL